MRRLLMTGLVTGMLLVASGTFFSHIMAEDVFNTGAEIIRISNEDDLRDYIDSNGVPSSEDHTYGHDTFGNVHELQIDEEGELVICSLGINLVGNPMGDIVFQMYSDFELTSQVIKEDVQKSSRSEFIHYSAKPGTYYYRLNQWNGYSNEYLDIWNRTFIGFIPADGVVADEDINERSYEDASYEEIEIIPVRDDVDLCTYINSDGIPSSEDHTYGHDTFSDTYQFSVNEPGELVLCVTTSNLNNDPCGDITIQLYSDAALTSEIVCQDVQSNVFGEYIHVPVTPGVYYYRLHQWNGYSTEYLDVRERSFIGFIADEINVSDDYETNRKYETIEYDPVVPQTYENTESFLDAIASGTNVTLNEKTYGADTKTPIYEFEVSEPSLLLEHVEAINTKREPFKDVVFKLYSDSAITSRIMKCDVNTDNESYSSLLLDPGKYYFMVYQWNGYSKEYLDVDIVEYLGLIPGSSVFSINSMSTNEQGVTEIDFNVSKEYHEGMIKIERGAFRSCDIDNQDLWKEGSRENAIPGIHAEISEPGIYTARLSANGLQSWPIQFTVGENSEDTITVVPSPETSETEAEEISEAETEKASMSLEEENEMLKRILEENGIEISDLEG